MGLVVQVSISSTRTPHSLPTHPSHTTHNADMAAPFDFAAAARLREERAKELLNAEEARNAAAAAAADRSSDEALAGGIYRGGGGGSGLHPPPNVVGGSSPVERQQLLYRGVVEALKSAGVQLLRPPVIEVAEGNLAYTVRGREGLDLYELKLSAQRQFVLMRATKSKGAFGPTGLAAADVPEAVADVSIPIVGQTLTLMLDQSRYVVERESGALVLVNESLLISNLNENVLARYGLKASRVHADAAAAEKGGFAKRPATTALVVLSAALVAAVAVVVAARARRKV